jgi:catechol 2,3-dioxygenase-like lactoylglutathione lyase family enzyme
MQRHRALTVTAAHCVLTSERKRQMQQQLSFVTLGIGELPRSRRFYVEGFGWSPVFENEEIIFYQMAGFVLGTFLKSALEEDMNRTGLASPGAFSLAHNVLDKESVEVVMQKLVVAGGTVLRAADVPKHGGFRGYVADPDDHAWEIAWTPGVNIDERGLVTFGL